MNHQDDLELNYRASSNEQPSSEIDRLIILAATDALSSDSNSKETAKVKINSSNNIVTGRFNLRRWQMPVSIAAAALFTFSFINTYDLWKSNDAEMIATEELVSLDSTLKKDTVAKKQKARYLSSSKAEDVAELSMPSALKAPITETSLAGASFDEKEQITQLRKESQKLSVEKWFEQIEANIAINNIEIAKSDIVILLQQHPLQSFSKQQHQRFAIINKKVLVQ